MSEETTVPVEGGDSVPTPVADLDSILVEAQGHLARVVALQVEAQAHADAMKQSRDELAQILENGGRDLAQLKVVSNAVAAAGDKVTTEQGVIATKSAHIQDAQEHADKVRAELDKLLTAVTGNASKTEAFETRASTAVEAIAAAGAAAAASKTAMELDAAAIKDALQRSEQSAKESKGLADRAAKVDQVLKDYEQRLNGLNEQSLKQLETIKTLLPGATSAGLASAFNTRAGSFKDPQRHWQTIFVGSLLALILLGITGIWHALTATTVLTYDELVRLWLTRLPVAGALLWLTLHAARETALAKRLEEDYGYKSAIASSFEGFNQQMSKIGDLAAPGSPLERLCTDTLATIASPPGRIYEKHRLTVSPSHEIAELSAALLAAVKASPAKSGSENKAAEE